MPARLASISSNLLDSVSRRSVLIICNKKTSRMATRPPNEASRLACRYGFLGLLAGPLSRLRLLLLGGGDALVELLDAACRVHELLLPGEQRVARRADFDRDLFHRRTGRKRVSTSAVDPRL